MCKKGIYFILIGIILLLFANCKDNTKEYTYDIYTAGYYKNNKDIRIACYWIKSKIVELGNGQRDSVGKALAIENNDIYVAGYYTNEDDIKVACYWKNGERVDVGDGKTDSMIEDMYLDKGTLHFVGIMGRQTSVYWKNGDVVEITDGKEDSEVTKVKVYNGSVYIVGVEVMEDEKRGTIHSAFLWKDGKKVQLELEGNGGHPKDIIVRDGDIYIAGNVGIAYLTACYWKNGELIELADYSSTAYGVEKLDKNLFFVGEISEKACYWKNKKMVELIPKKSEFRSASSRAFKIIPNDNGDIVIVGKYYKWDDEKSTLCYWLNGELINISDGKYHSYYGDSVVIRREVQE